MGAGLLPRVDAAWNDALTQILGVVAAMAAEARALSPLRRTAGGLQLRDDGTLVSISGIGAGAATAGAQALAAGGATALMSFGMAGGLDPALEPGCIVVPDRVISREGAAYAISQGWAGRIFSLLRAQIPAPATVSVRGALLTSPCAVDDAVEKSALFRDTGAVAVDMESAAVAAVAAERGLPFVAVRVIVDSARDHLPRAVVAASRAGQVHVPTLIFGLLRAPGEILPLLRLARRFAAANQSLTAVAAVLRHAGP